jgi:hypothetical protein
MVQGAVGKSEYRIEEGFVRECWWHDQTVGRRKNTDILVSMQLNSWKS